MKTLHQNLSDKIYVAVFIATIIVVIRHSINVHVYYPDIYIKGFVDINSFLQLFINSLTDNAVPFFFVISGYLFFNKFSIDNTFLYYRKRFRTLVVPYVVWNTLMFLFLMVIQNLEFAVAYSNYEMLRPDFDTFQKILLIDPVLGQLWYVRDLIIFVLISPLIFWLLKIRQIFFFFVLFLVYNWSPIDTSFFSSEGILFYSVGGFLGVHKNNLEMNFSKGLLGILIVVWLFLKLLLVCGILEGASIMSLQKVSITIGIIVLWRSLDFIEYKDRIIALSSFSFFIYVFHSPLIKIFFKVSLAVLPESELIGLLIYIVTPFVIVYSSVHLAKCLEKYANRFYSLLTGNR